MPALLERAEAEPPRKNGAVEEVGEVTAEALQMDAEGAYAYLRAKFVMARPARVLIKRHRLKFRYGAFSPRETALCAAAVASFLDSHGLPLSALHAHLTDDAPFPLLELVLHAVAAIPHRTFKAVHTHVAFAYHPQIASRFSPDDDLALLQLVQQHGFSWKSIAHQLEKYRDTCRRRFLALRGEERRGVTLGMVREVVARRLPRSEGEWREEAVRMGVAPEQLVRRVCKFLRTREFLREEEERREMQLGLLVLAFNYFCPVDVEELLTWVRAGVGGVGDVHAGNSFYTAGRGSEAGIKDGERAGGSDAEGEVPAGVGSAPIQSLAHLSLDFNIQIVLTDVFWETITRETGLDPTVLRTQFQVLSKAERLDTYEDLRRFVLRLVKAEEHRRCIQRAFRTGGSSMGIAHNKLF